MKEQFRLDNQLCFRLYTASRLITQEYHPLLVGYGLTYPQYLVWLVLWEKVAQPVNDIAKRLLLETNTVTPLLKRMEAEGILTRTKGEKDARLSEVPEAVGSAVLCESVTPETVPALFKMLDDIIKQLKDNTNNTTD